MARTFFMELNRLDEAETEVTVEYMFRAGGPDTYDASRGGPGGWDPGDPAECEIVSAWETKSEKDIMWTDAEDEKWCEHIIERHVDNYDDDPEL